MKKISKHLISFAIMALLVLPVFALPAAAQTDPFGIDVVDTGLSGTLDNTSTPIEIITNIINIALGFLGIIAVGIILIGGFKWMTAAGNEDKTGEAKQLLGAGIIGLVIILAAWALATFVINQIYGATGGVTQ
jgi:Zn-dependent protease with chaperone function